MTTRLLILISLLMCHAAFGAEQSRWFKCESSDDCVLARGPCGDATAVNRSFRWLFEKSSKSVVCKKATDYKADRKLKTAGCGLEGKCVTGTRPTQ
jgi:hypothetical protein